MPAFAYDTAQIIKWLGSHTVAKARGYVDEVTRLHWDEDVLRATVQGTQRQPYSVEVMFNDHNGALSAQGHFVHVYVDRITREPTPLPDAMRQLLQTIVNAPT